MISNPSQLKACAQRTNNCRSYSKQDHFTNRLKYQKDYETNFEKDTHIDIFDVPVFKEFEVFLETSGIIYFGKRLEKVSNIVFLFTLAVTKIVGLLS